MNWIPKRIRVFMRGTKEERPEKVRLSIEITQCLVKRETSLAEALDTLTAVMLNALAAKYGDRDEFFRFNEQVSMFLGSTERDRAVVGAIPRKQPGGLAAKAQPRTVTTAEERAERVRHLAIEIGELLNKSGRPGCAHRDDAHRHRSHLRARKGGRVRPAYGGVLKRGDQVLRRAGSVVMMRRDCAYVPWPVQALGRWARVFRSALHDAFHRDSSTVVIRCLHSKS